MQCLVQLLAFAELGTEPPAEFRIWPFGVTETSKGIVNLDPESAAAVVAKWKLKGIDLAIDYEHQTLNSTHNGRPAPAAGWFRPEVRADGLWAVDVKWTDTAAAHLKAREYRYFSPVADIDVKTRKPVELHPMALTNMPATRNLAALVARDDGANPSLEKPMKTVLVALGLRDDAEESSAVREATTLVELRRSVLAMTDKQTVDEALGVLTAHKALAAETTKLKADMAEAEKLALIDAAVVAGKLPPAEKETFIALGRDHGLPSLKAALAVLKVQPGQGGSAKQTEKLKTGGAGQMAAVEAYKKAHPDAQTGDAYIACAKENPDLFAQVDGLEA